MATFRIFNTVGSERRYAYAANVEEAASKARNQAAIMAAELLKTFVDREGEIKIVKNLNDKGGKLEILAREKTFDNKNLAFVSSAFKVAEIIWEPVPLSANVEETQLDLFKESPCDHTAIIL